jgi:hypothetical protein
VFTAWNEDEKTFVWSYRNWIVSSRPSAISRVLSCCSWDDPRQVSEVYRLLKQLEEKPTLPPFTALEV